MEILQTQLNGKKMQVVLQSLSTRHGFKHEATLLDEKGYSVGFAKICYLNRTWERYRFESVIHKVVNNTQFEKDENQNAKIQKRLCRQFDKQAQKHRFW